jgi:hypothetical protein
MKKALSAVLLLSGLLLYGCSGGGTSASSDGSNSTSNPGGGSPSGPSNGFTIKVVDRSSITPTNATDVRVVVTRWHDELTPQSCVDENGDPIVPCPDPVLVPTLVWKDIVDKPISSGSVTIGIPRGVNYTLDVITYNAATTNSIVSYGSATGVLVDVASTATVTVHDASSILNMVVSSPTVTSKAKFDVTLNNVLPFAPRYKMTMSVVPAITGIDPYPVNTSAPKCTFTAPETTLAGESVHLVGEFTINTSFLKQGESAAKWTYGEELFTDLTPLIPITINNL